MLFLTCNRVRFIALLLAVGVSIGLYSAFRSTAEVHAQGGDKKAGGKKDDGNETDRAAIQKTVRGFIAALEKGDAKSAAGHWTENGEYHSDDGTVLQGRAVIEKEYVAAFAKRKTKIKIDVDVESIRFPSKDTAIEEGHFTIHADKDHSTASKYTTVLHVREGGQWLMAVVREWPRAGVSVRDLDWLIGTWIAKSDDIEIKSAYEWWGDKSFLHAHSSTSRRRTKRSPGSR